MISHNDRLPLATKNEMLARFGVRALLGGAFEKQRAFIADPRKLKALFCTRRSAKSYTAGIYLTIEALLNPGCNCLFVGLTRQSAKSIIWKDILRVINDRFKIGAQPHLTELAWLFPNGSIIKVVGADTDEEEMNKLLGAKYRLVCIDEASMYTISLSNLVYGVLKPAMTDPNLRGERGTICLMGTASNFTRGIFYDITTHREPGWSVHTWSAHDNPYVAKQWQEELDEIQTQRPLYMETPQFKQWYLNKWVVDEEKLVYKFNETKNLYDKLPLKPLGWTYILGIDTGWDDDNAFVLCGYHENDPTLYIIRTFNKPKMTFPEVVDKINEFMSHPTQSPCKVIIDGANKQGVESMRVRSSIPFEYADKQSKNDFIEMLNGDLVQAKIKINREECRPLIDEMMSLVWKTDGDKIVIPKREHPSLRNHLCDATLYAWRCGFHYNAAPVEIKYPKYSKAWYDQQADNVWEQERDKLIKDSSDDGRWPNDGGWGKN